MDKPLDKAVSLLPTYSQIHIAHTNRTSQSRSNSQQNKLS